MNNITIDDLIAYLRLTEVIEEERSMLSSMLNIAIAYIQSYTGLSNEELSTYEDIKIVIYVLVSDMWDNRSLYVNTDNLNLTVKTILDLHSRNLLPKEVN